VKRNIYTLFGRHCRFREKESQVGDRTGNKLMATETDKVQAFVRQPIHYLLKVLFVGIADGKRKQNKSGIRGCRKCCDEPSVALVHGEDTRPLFQMRFGILHGQIVGKIVAHVPKAVEMGIETENQGVMG
jgi:hypothetical protein